MSYIGNQLLTSAFVTDQFSGTGSQTAFTMSVAPANSASAIVAISGVLQEPSTYGVAGTTLTFSAAPPTGTGNISVRYLGIPASGVTTQAYRTITEFTATAGQTTFSPPSYNVGFINVYRNGVRLASADFTASNGTTVVLTNAATTNDIIMTESFQISSVLNAIPANGGSVTAAYLDAPNKDGTGGVNIPSGTTAQRAVSPVAGQTRFNSTTGFAEYWNGSVWATYGSVSPSIVSYLIVAGGGGGGGNTVSGYNGSGGGGAGGLLTSTIGVTAGSVYTIIVGAGGNGTPGEVNPSLATYCGTNSSAFGLTAIGGGAGGGTEGSTASYANGASGGSGGGCKQTATSNYNYGAGTTGQGNRGGAGVNAGGGGGGGASAVGGDAPSLSQAGAGGAGTASSITGSSVTYAGGGGGGCYNNGSGGGAGGAGGAGGGGTGSASGGTNTATAGTTNTGGGGGGNAGNTGSGKNGGSGVVVISYSSSFKDATVYSGTYSKNSVGGNTIYTFTSSGSISF